MTDRIYYIAETLLTNFLNFNNLKCKSVVLQQFVQKQQRLDICAQLDISDVYLNYNCALHPPELTHSGAG